MGFVLIRMDTNLEDEDSTKRERLPTVVGVTIKIRVKEVDELEESGSPRSLVVGTHRVGLVYEEVYSSLHNPPFPVDVYKN